ncbi:cytochrome b/b6 domain-containing protein [Microbacterium sp. SSW1-59]|uniref:cytochrome b/b6 domain-containing protein n=1 Tax=Microbacterium xanthum TaxID=3079794 RepID=UPI002AD509E5|nr:cytochrome b/b6 domain-containing protein [Microbacterium sp. SSW1-59]MDZ8201008.1 cytochrome b/b6 domain-containing protein [Microbacterium sp. SSW1-59]
MTTSPRTLRRGLPRHPGGEAWPPADAPLPPSDAADVSSADGADATAEQGAGVHGAAPQSHSAERGAEPRAASRRRRGLPRVRGGEPWPPATASVAVSADAGSPTAATEPLPPTVASAAAPVAAVTPGSASPALGTHAAVITVRRGLPRTNGGDPWPPADVAPAPAVSARPTESDPTVTTASDVTVSGSPTAQALPSPESDAPAPAVAARADLSRPLPFTRTVWPGRAPRSAPPAPEARRVGPFTRLQWAGAVLVGGIGIVYAAGMLVLAMRWFASTEPMQAFLTAFPGEYHLPDGAPVGLPAWLGWQHFFNVFLMVLIIRTGLRVRTEKRPTAFWAPRTDPKRKISLNLWFHQSLDILWVVNGLVFVVLLFATGQWMRIVPTSWEVFPNALSAAIQYLTLDWPTENGWVNYNSLQQLAYFTTVFVAAPLAIITGVRMSGIWPSGNKALNRAYPVEWARALHFPVMLFFVLFIFVHVVLVLSTGALRNLNHMYAAQGTVDPGAYADNWTGFWIFAASLVVIAGAWVAARPLVLAPIARLFGTVSGR